MVGHGVYNWNVKRIKRGIKFWKVGSHSLDKRVLN